MTRVPVDAVAGLFLLLAGLASWMLFSADAQQRFPTPGAGYPQGAMAPYNGRNNAPYAPYAPYAPENILIVLDASYSMSESIGGESKMALAKRTIMRVLQRVPPNVNVGLRVYGTSTSALTACSSTKLLVPIGANNRPMIANAVSRIQPKGATPISYTLERAVREDFMGLPGKKSVILVSDGMETCGEDPCSVTVEMVRQGIDVKIDVIGFGIRDYAAIRQLRCIALSTFGQFSTANTQAELAKSLNSAMHADTQVQGQILPPNGSGAPTVPTIPIVPTVPNRNALPRPPAYNRP